VRSAILRRFDRLLASSLILADSSYSSVQTQSIKPNDASFILNTQRLARPSSPHFTIYQPQLTWIASIANRVTGAGLSLRASSFLTRVPTQRGIQSSTVSPSRIFSLLPHLAARISSNLLRASQSGSKLLRRQSLPRHLPSTHSTACVTSLGIPENVCLFYTFVHDVMTLTNVKSCPSRVHTVQAM